MENSELVAVEASEDYRFIGVISELDGLEASNSVAFEGGDKNCSSLRTRSNEKRKRLQRADGKYSSIHEIIDVHPPIKQSVSSADEQELGVTLGRANNSGLRMINHDF